jgi:hypothetical protein
MAKPKYDKELYESIKTDLLTQLDNNDAIGKHYEDLINDYMSFWVTKQMLIKDIEDRGVTCKYNNGGGQSGYKKNDSVAELVKVNAQMLKILSELCLKPLKQSGKNDPDDENYM